MMESRGGASRVSSERCLGGVDHDLGIGDRLVGVDDVMRVLGVSESSAYRVIRELNAELAARGLRTFEGRLSRNYLAMRFLVPPTVIVNRPGREDSAVSDGALSAMLGV